MKTLLFLLFFTIFLFCFRCPVSCIKALPVYISTASFTIPTNKKELMTYRKEFC